MNLLGIDWGEKKVGLAISENGWIDSWGIIETQKASAEIAQLCQERKIEKIILGRPEGRIVKAVEAFGKELKRAIGLPLELQDETLTSQDAAVRMKEVGKKQRERRVEDAFAAAVILEGYLERKNKSEY
ncbi:MAG: Holliday junction resolvase RuvX [Candidatus Shapirobacteria bacterium]